MYSLQISCNRSSERCPAAFVKSLATNANQSGSRSSESLNHADPPETLAKAFCPFRAVVRVLGSSHSLDRFVQEDVVGAAEAAASLLQRLADRVDREVATDLLVDDGADETARDAPAALRGEEVGISKLCELLLEFRGATRDNVGELVVDEQKDERDGFDRLNEEEAESRERRLLGGVSSRVVTGTARIGNVGKEVLFAVGGVKFS